MKITCDREKLLTAFQLASAVVPARSPKPILQNVKLETGGGGGPAETGEAAPDLATLLATDLEIGLRVIVGGIQVEAPGSAVLPIARFGSILRESSDATLSLESDGQVMVVKGQRSEFRLPTANSAEFPAVAQFNEERYHELPARAVRELVRRTVFATDTESSRYALGGVLLEMGPDSVTAVGTDGRRLATMKTPARSINEHSTVENTTIIPTRSMHLIDRSLTDADADVQIAARANDIMVRSPRVTIYTRLVEGRYPKWRDVFPRRTGAVQIELLAGPMHAAVRQAAIVTSDESRGVDFTFAQGKVVLSGKAAEHGQSRIEMPVAYDGAPLSITLDPRYFADFLKVLDPDKTFSLELKDSESAAVCTADDGYSYVIMPLSRDR